MCAPGLGEPTSCSWRKRRRSPSARVRERAFAARGHITKVELRVHDLVVAHERDDLAPGALSVRLQLLEEVDDLPVVVAAIDRIARLGDDELAADPGVLVIDRSRET